VQQSVTVVRRSQTVAFTSTAPSPATVGATYTPGASATSGLPVELTVDATSAGVCSLSLGIVTFNATGTCTIDANQPGNPAYSAAPQVQQSVTVVRQGQTISFTSANPSPGAVGGTYTPAVAATSGLPVTVTIDAASTGVCSLSGAVVTFDAVGTCTIDADQAGNSTYGAAPEVQQSVTVTAPATSQGACESLGGTFGTATSLWTCTGVPSAPSDDWTSMSNHCMADGGAAASAVLTASGWNYTCYAGALYALLLAIGGAVAGVLWASFHGTDVP
jgi:hypothetical protein